MMRVNKLWPVLVGTLFTLGLVEAQAGSFRDLAKIEALRSSKSKSVRELMEAIETYDRVMTRLGYAGQPSDYNPAGINRALGEIRSFNQKLRARSFEPEYLPFLLQDVQNITSEFAGATINQRCKSESTCSARATRPTPRGSVGNGRLIHFGSDVYVEID